MPASASKDGRRLTGYRGDTLDNNENNSNIGHIQHQSLYDDDMKGHQQYQTDEVYDEYDEDLDDGDHKADDDHSDTGSELSVPNSTIDFDMVYALHTFGATVEGQASVVRGDALTLLDDSNSYWWLVKVLKTAEVGYIPAENIETPHERLARLNSHRNIQASSKHNQNDYPPSTKPKSTKRVTLAKGVQFQSQIIYGSSDDEDDFESEFNLWHERMNSDDSDDSDDSEDPYNYYENPHDAFDAASHPMDIYSSYNTTQPATDNDCNLSTDSDIINDREDQIKYSQNNRGSDLDETIKISLTPSIAREDSNRASVISNRSSDSTLQTKLKKAAKLERLLSGPSEEKKEKSGIRKFFSRNSSLGSKEKKNKDKHSSTGSSVLETGSITESIEIAPADDIPSMRIQLLSGNMDFESKYIMIDATTTASELIQDALEEMDMANDYYVIVSHNKEEYTLVPSDKPYEIYQSLTAHLNTPMPSLKKARRISQMMMGNDDTHMGGPKDNQHQTLNENVHFYLYYKPKRIEEGEIQIKVCLVADKRQDKLVKIPSSLVVRDVISLLLEKFHVLNGIVDDVATPDAIDSLRLDGNDIVKYQLVMYKNNEEHVLSLDDRLLSAFGDDIPPIQYRRNSNPDRSSITVNIAPPETHETHFVLRCTEENVAAPKRPHRQNTPMPVPEPLHTPNQPLPQYQPQVVIDTHDMMSSPEQVMDSDSEEEEKEEVKEVREIVPEVDETPPPPPTHRSRRQSTESMLFCNDFGMNDLMTLIRGAARNEANASKYGHQSYHIRSEILDVFKDHQSRLDQLEKELDRIMSESIRVYH